MRQGRKAYRWGFQLNSSQGASHGRFDVEATAGKLVQQLGHLFVLQALLRSVKAERAAGMHVALT